MLEIVCTVVGILLILGVYLFDKKWRREFKLECSAAKAERVAKRFEIGEILYGKKVCVIIRETNGSVSDLDTVIIEELVECGAHVLNIPVPQGNKLWKGDVDILFNDSSVEFIILGTAWTERTDTFKAMSRGTTTIYTLDFRILTSDGKKVIVIGGSLIGLLAANLFHRRGWDVQVYERVPEDLEGRGVTGSGVTDVFVSDTMAARNGWAAGANINVVVNDTLSMLRCPTVSVT